MARTTASRGVTALAGLSALVAFVALAGLGVLAGERIEAAAAESPVVYVAVVGAGLAIPVLVVARRRGVFERGESLEPTRRIDATGRIDASRRIDTEGRPGGRSSAEREAAAERGSPAEPGAAVDRLTRAEARELLDVGLTADEAEIRRAYRERVRDLHPDRGGDEADFRRLTAAYERLLDEPWE